MREETPPTKDEPETQSRALAIAAMAGVAVGALGLAAWVRSRKRFVSSARTARRAAGFSEGPAEAAPQQEPAEPAEPGLVMPAGVEGEVRIEGDRVIVVGPIGAGARARVYQRADWDFAINGSDAKPLQPTYEISRPSPHAAWLAAMDHVRAKAKEGEVS
jgi:hypothetical protein